MMMRLLLKKTIILPVILAYLLLTNYSVLSQTNSNVLKEGNLRFEQLIVNLRTTLELV
jgi:hypothetical protein